MPNPVREAKGGYAPPMGRDARRAWAQTLVGRTVGERYALETLLDVGGMGAVFVGRHLEVDRPVAIKTVVPGALDARGAERLRREAQQAASVGGRGVVDVTDFGVDEVCGPFLVMELLEGETLGARLDRGPIPLEEAVAIVDEVLATLARIHARGLIHRDLKPDNVFLARIDGARVIKILDFGIARPMHRGDGDTLTAPGALVGTPRFMAPEQARDARGVDARADVYSVAAILYALLSGRRPYEDLAGDDLVTAMTAGPPRPLRELAPGVPPALAAVVDRSLARDPGRRPPDAASLRAALRRGAGELRSDDGDPSTVTSAPIDRGTRPKERRGWWIAALLVGIVGALVWGALRDGSESGAASEASASIGAAAGAGFEAEAEAETETEAESEAESASGAGAEAGAEAEAESEAAAAAEAEAAAEAASASDAESGVASGGRGASGARRRGGARGTRVGTTETDDTAVGETADEMAADEAAAEEAAARGRTGTLSLEDF